MNSILDHPQLIKELKNQMDTLYAINTRITLVSFRLILIRRYVFPVVREMRRELEILNGTT